MKKHLLAMLATTLLAATCAQAQTYVLRIPAQGMVPTVTGHAALTPMQLDFGSHDVGTNSASQSIQVTNDGAAPITVDGISVVAGAGHFGASNNCGVHLAPGASCQIAVAMTPSRSGPLTGTLAAMVAGGTTLIDLNGAGTAATPAATPAALAFGTVAQGSMLDRTATLANYGPGSLRVDRAVLAGDSAGFSIAADACSGAYLASGGACTVTVRFTSADALAHNASLHLQSSAEAPADNLAIALSAAGGPDAAQVSPGSLTFAGTAVGSTSAAQAITVTNPNAFALTFGTPSFTQGQANFVRTGGSCVNGAALAAYGNCTVTVALAPQAAGSLTGTLHLPVGDTTLAVTLTGTGQAGVLAISKTAHAFGNLAVGTKANVTLTVSNTGTTTTSLATTGLAAPYAKTTSSTCGATLAEGSSCTVIVEFAPTTTGSNNQTLTLAGGPGVASKTVDLTGTGVAPAMTFKDNTSGATLSSIVLDTTPVGSNSANLVVKVVNSGTANLTFSGAPFAAAAPFSVVTSNCSTVAPNGSCTVTLKFSPTAAQAYNGSYLSTTSNVTNPTLPALVGTGTMVNVAQIVTGVLSESTFVQRLDGSWTAAGWNNMGQLGLGDTANRTTFTVVPALNGATQVVHSYNHTFARFANGSWVAAGANARGQLGLGDITPRTTFTAVSALSGATQVAMHSSGTFAKLSNGSWAATGGNVGLGGTDYTYFTTLTALSGASQLVVGGGHAFAKLSNGTWVATGYNGNGQLGLGNTTSFTSFTAVAALNGATQVALGNSHTIAKLSNGSWAVTGYNYDGQLGLGDTVQRTSFITVPALAGATQVVLGASSSFARMANGSWIAAGNNGNGQLGLGHYTDRALFETVPALDGATQVVAGRDHTFAKLSSTAWAGTGSNGQGQLGMATRNTFALVSAIQ
jgi:alpha-tubulin suppressor-like RCC1 family protein